MNNSTVFELFCQQAEKSPRQCALIIEDNRYSYRELMNMAIRVASQLEQAGVQSQDKIGIILPNSPEFVVLMLAASALGCVLVPQSTSSGPGAMRTAFVAADVSHCVVFAGRKQDLHEALSSVITGRFFVFCETMTPASANKDRESFIALSLDSAEDQNLQAVVDLNKPADPELPYILTVTSGSTGAPKPIILSQGTKVRRAMAAARLYDVSARDVVLTATPLYHSLAQRLVIMPLILGGTAVVLPHYSPALWLQAVARYQVSFSIAVASQLAQLEQSLETQRDSLSSLRCLVSSSERLDQSLKQRLKDSLACELHECYGASEVAIVTNLFATDDSVPLDSVGKVLPGVDVQIMDEQNQPAAIGAIGEIACKTPMRFSGYYKQPELTAASFWGDYFRTGDLGYLDQQGNLHYVGRKKELIIVGGINVYPKDIEQVILDLPGVAECAVVGRSSLQFNEEPVAFVVLRQGGSVDKRDIMRACLNELADYQQPREILIVDALPKNPVGKIVKRALFEALENNDIKKIA